MQVTREVQQASRRGSNFMRYSDARDLEELSITTLYNSAHEHIPLLTGCLDAAAMYNDDRDIEHAVVTAVAILLHNRNRRIDLLQRMISVDLFKGGAKKIVSLFL